MQKLYHISIKEGSNDIYVTVLTKNGTHSFWNDLANEVRTMQRPNVTVYFDYLYRNGFNNRLFASRTDINSICQLDLKPLSAKDISFDIKIFDHFYASNCDYLTTSMLPALQRNVYIKKLTRNQ